MRVGAYRIPAGSAGGFVATTLFTMGEDHDTYVRGSGGRRRARAARAAAWVFAAGHTVECGGGQSLRGVLAVLGGARPRSRRERRSRRRDANTGSMTLSPHPAPRASATACDVPEQGTNASAGRTRWVFAPGPDAVPPSAVAKALPSRSPCGREKTSRPGTGTRFTPSGRPSFGLHSLLGGDPGCRVGHSRVRTRPYSPLPARVGGACSPKRFPSVPAGVAERRGRGRTAGLPLLGLTQRSVAAFRLSEWRRPARPRFAPGCPGRFQPAP
ncbi:hypothetical protein GA0115246_104657 [Streptomyces sp. SolWspMP-sol7th]|nr:hypothetical protein GA0115246_104657 [Streptomyces sp. SolWspMP-sol7th]